MIELTIVLFVSASLVVGVFSFGTIVIGRQKVEDLVKRVDLVASSAHDSIIAQGSAQTNATNMATQLTNSGGFPERLVDGADIKTPYGDNLQVKGNSNDKIIITLSNMPQNACFGVGQYVISQSKRFSSFKIGTTTFNASSTTTLENMRATNLTTPCSGSGSSRPVIELTYK